MPEFSPGELVVFTTEKNIVLFQVASATMDIVKAIPGSVIRCKRSEVNKATANWRIIPVEVYPRSGVRNNVGVNLREIYEKFNTV